MSLHESLFDQNEAIIVLLLQNQSHVLADLSDFCFDQTQTPSQIISPKTTQNELIIIPSLILYRQKCLFLNNKRKPFPPHLFFDLPSIVGQLPIDKCFGNLVTKFSSFKRRPAALIKNILRTNRPFFIWID